jgi:hypothetical protein
MKQRQKRYDFMYVCVLRACVFVCTHAYMYYVISIHDFNLRNIKAIKQLFVINKCSADPRGCTV